MDVAHLDEAIEQLEKANADLEPELLSIPAARERLEAYARAEKLAAFGVASLSRKLDDAAELAALTGTSMGKAKATVATGRVLGSAPELSAALEQGTVSLDQATEIARAEEAAPGCAGTLVKVAGEESFQVLKDRARRVKLEAEQHRDLAERQRAARGARSHSDPLGMIHIHLELQPHVGTPIVARAEAEAARLARAARAAAKKAPKHTRAGQDEVTLEPFERYLADAYAALLSGTPGKGRARRPELVVLVSHEVTQRGWKDVRPGETCRIPGVGPVAPQVARAIAGDAFLNGVFFDGRDLRHFKRWSRDLPIEVQVALELGQPPDFDGIRCVDCGNHFRNENDHVEPRVAQGPASTGNLRPRCWSCHRAKTERDRRAGKLRPAEP